MKLNIYSTQTSNQTVHHFNTLDLVQFVTDCLAADPLWCNIEMSNKLVAGYLKQRKKEKGDCIMTVKERFITFIAIVVMSVSCDR